MTLSIGGIEVGGENPCRFIAEISCNHGGSLDRALRLITAAKDAGADFVKFQCYTPDELVQLRGDGPAPEPWGSQGWTMRALYEKAQTPHDWFPTLVEYCRDLEIPWFSSVFGPQSLALLESLGCPAYKIARLDNCDVDLLEAARATRRQVIVSAALPSESAWDGPTHETAIWLYCPPGYPQQPPFRFGRRWMMDFPYYTGFSYHGTDPLPCVVAATLGAKLIEAHFQLDDESSELEASVSLSASAFKRMVEDVRRVEGMLA